MSEEELEKVKNKFESNELFGNMNYQQLAYNLAFFELAGGNAGMVNEEVPRYRSITAGQLQSIVRRAIDRSNCCIIYYHAQK